MSPNSKRLKLLHVGLYETKYRKLEESAGGTPSFPNSKVKDSIQKFVHLQEETKPQTLLPRNRIDEPEVIYEGTNDGEEQLVESQVSANLESHDDLTENLNDVGKSDDLDWLGYNEEKRALLLSLHAYNWDNVQNYAGSDLPRFVEKLKKGGRDAILLLLRTAIHPEKEKDLVNLITDESIWGSQTMFSPPQIQTIRKRHWAMSCIRFPMVQHYEDSRFGIRRLISFFARWFYKKISPSERDLYWTFFAHCRIHAWLAADVFFTCLETYSLLEESGNLLHYAKQFIPSLSQALRSVLCFRIAHEVTALYTNPKNNPYLLKSELPWRRICAIVLLVEGDVISFNFVWKCLETRLPSTWKAEVRKYYEKIMSLAQKRKMKIIIDGPMEGELENIVHIPPELPQCLIHNPCLGFISAALTLKSFNSGIRALQFCGRKVALEYSPLEKRRNIVHTLLNTIHTYENTIPMEVVISLGPRIGEDPTLFFSLLRLSRFRENNLFMSKCAIPGMILCAEYQSLAVQLPYFSRFPLNAHGPLVAAKRKVMEETLHYVIRRVTPENVFFYSRMLIPILNSYPHIVLDKMMEQAIGYHDPSLMGMHAQLLKYAQNGVVKLLFEEAYLSAFRLCERQGLQALDAINSLSTLFSIVWRHHIHAISLEYFFEKTLSCLFSAVQIAFLRSVQENLLFLPSFSEETWNNQQLQALGCGPVTKWFTSGGYSLYTQIQNYDSQVSLQQWFFNYHIVLSFVRTKEKKIGTQLRKTHRQLLESFRDDDSLDSTKVELLGTIRNLQAATSDLLATFTDYTTSENLEETFFCRYRLYDISHTSSYYTATLDLIEKEETYSIKKTKTVIPHNDSVYKTQSSERTNLKTYVHDHYHNNFFETLKLIIHQELYIHKTHVDVIHQKLSEEIRKSNTDLCPTLPEIMRRAINSPHDALYCALFLKRYVKLSREEIIDFVSTLLYFISSYSIVESAYIGIFLGEVFKYFTNEGWLIQEFCTAHFRNALRRPMQYIHYNILNVLWEIREAFSEYRKMRDTLLPYLEPFLLRDSPLKPKALAVVNFLRENKKKFPLDWQMNIYYSHFSARNSASLNKIVYSIEQNKE